MACSYTMPGMVTKGRWLKPYTLGLTGLVLGLLLGLLAGEGMSGRLLLFSRSWSLPAKQTTSTFEWIQCAAGAEVGTVVAQYLYCTVLQPSEGVLRKRRRILEGTMADPCTVCALSSHTHAKHRPALPWLLPAAAAAGSYLLAATCWQPIDTSSVPQPPAAAAAPAAIAQRHLQPCTYLLRVQ